MEDNIAISVKNLSKNYKIYNSPIHRLKEFLHPFKEKYHTTFCALRDINFDIPKGTTFGIVGQNGSGKSTLLQIITGIIRPTDGTVNVNGKISALLELGAGFHREFTGRENVYLQGALMSINREEIDAQFSHIERFADIGSFIDQPVKTYSSGMYVRLAFATAINVNADILIIDEVLAVGDDMFKRRCYRKLEEFQEQGKTILFVSHSLPTVASVCNSAMLLDKGNILRVGDTKDVINVYSKLVSVREEEYLRKANNKNKIHNLIRDEPDDRFEGPKSVTDSEYRYGSGGAEFLDIELLNRKNEKVHILEHGENFTIRASILFKKSMNNPMIGYKIRTLTGIDVSGTNTTIANTPTGKVEEGCIATIEFNQKMTLNKGSYTLTTGVSEEVSKQMIYHDRRMDAIVFNVLGNSPKSGGLVDMDTSIHFTLNSPKHTAS